ncbi:MAG TPA: hypothetical protein VFX59_23365, partial [Polyangiales bacterium]|nr:hypothetical protein [Polyangiales bacterium]
VSYSGLIADGADVLFGHFETSRVGKARFYIDRLDLSAQPKLAAKVNVPGSLLHYDRAHSRALTSQLNRVEVAGVSPEACYARFSYSIFDYPSNWDGNTAITGKCTGFTQTLHLVQITGTEAKLEGSYPLAERERISSSSYSEGRVAAVISRGDSVWGYGRGIVDGACWGGCFWGSTVGEAVDLLTLGGFDSGVLASGRLSVRNDPNAWWGWWGAPPVYLSGARALVQGTTDAAIVDVSNVTAPALVRRVPLYGQAYNITGSGNIVLLPLYSIGVQRIDL